MNNPKEEFPLCKGCKYFFQNECTNTEVTDLGACYTPNPRYIPV